MGEMSAETHLDLVDLYILDMLCSGLPDAAIGRRLGIGHRTVQRRVRDLMTRLEVKSRVALGARAQELGLLKRSSRAAYTTGRPPMAAALSTTPVGRRDPASGPSMCPCGTRLCRRREYELPN